MTLRCQVYPRGPPEPPDQCLRHDDRREGIRHAVVHGIRTDGMPLAAAADAVASAEKRRTMGGCRAARCGSSVILTTLKLYCTATSPGSSAIFTIALP